MNAGRAPKQCRENQAESLAYLLNRLKIEFDKNVSLSIMTVFDFLKIASDDSEVAFNSAAWEKGRITSFHICCGRTGGRLGGNEGMHMWVVCVGENTCCDSSVIWC